MHLGRYLAITIVTIGLAAPAAHANDQNNNKQVTVLSNVQETPAAAQANQKRRLLRSKRPEAPSCDGGYAPRFRLGGEVQNPKTFHAWDLQRYFPSRFTFSFVSGGTAGSPRTYIGVPLLDLLNEAVVITDPNRQRNDFLRKYIVATGTDCYEAIIAYADLLPNFGGQQVFIAFATGDGQPLDETEGMARLFIIRDFQGGRHVSNVRSITVRSAP